MPQGDVYWVELDGAVGRELRTEAGKPRPVLVVSRQIPAEGYPVLVAPITTGAQATAYQSYIVALPPGLKTTGVVACHQLRTLDLAQRGARFQERVPTAVLLAVLARIYSLL
jgi:mRNA-degrading endonuclease toxin of MazEF toxin-antitoxin module